MVTRRTKVAVYGIATLVLAAGLAFYIVFATVRDFAPAHSPARAADSIYRLVLLTSGSGVIAFALVEFIKQVLPMRAWFNQQQVQRWFGDHVVSSAYSRQVKLPGATKSGRWETQPPIYFGASINDLTIQIAAALTDSFRKARGFGIQAADVVTAKNLPITTETWERLRRARSDAPEPTGISTDTDRAAVSDDDLTFDALVRGDIEAACDAFQLVASASWVRFLRVLGVVFSAFLAGVAVRSSYGHWSATLGATAFGAVVGGPISWTIADVVRVVLRRAG